MDALKRLWTKPAFRLSLGAIAGAGAGAAYSLTIGCKAGGCLLWSNPVVATLVGGALGAVLLAPSRKE